MLSSITSCYYFCFSLCRLLLQFRCCFPKSSFDSLAIYGNQQQQHSKLQRNRYIFFIRLLFTSSRSGKKYAFEFYTRLVFFLVVVFVCLVALIRYYFGFVRNNGINCCMCVCVVLILFWWAKWQHCRVCIVSHLIFNTCIMCWRSILWRQMMARWSRLDHFTKHF